MGYLIPNALVRACPSALISEDFVSHWILHLVENGRNLTKCEIKCRIKALNSGLLGQAHLNNWKLCTRRGQLALTLPKVSQSHGHSCIKAIPKQDSSRLNELVRTNCSHRNASNEEVVECRFHAVLSDKCAQPRAL